MLRDVSKNWERLNRNQAFARRGLRKLKGKVSAKWVHKRAWIKKHLTPYENQIDIGQKVGIKNG